MSIRNSLFTSEAVSAGHLDKLCDRRQDIRVVIPRSPNGSVYRLTFADFEYGNEVGQVLWTGETGSGTVGSANVTNIQVTCVTSTFSVGGTITGLTASGLILANGNDALSVSSGATTFTLPTKVATGASYAVTVKTQPSGLTCQVVNGTGLMASAAVTNVRVTCGQWIWKSGSDTKGAAGSMGLKVHRRRAMFRARAGLLRRGSTAQVISGSSVATATMPRAPMTSSMTYGSTAPAPASGIGWADRRRPMTLLAYMAPKEWQAPATRPANVIWPSRG
jgi:hypothetical protein